MLRLDDRHEEAGYRFECSAEIEVLFMHGVGAREFEEPLNKVTAELQPVFEAAQIVTGSVLAGPLTHELHTEQESRKWRVQVMGRACRHFSHAGQLFDLQHGLAPTHAFANIGGGL